MSADKEKNPIDPKLRVITYEADGDRIELNMALVRKHLVHPTKSGKQPSDSDVIAFMMLCKTQRLNPWVKDAILVGYDSHDGPQFNLITTVQALFKRAEQAADFNGIESGVIWVSDEESEPHFTEGDFLLPGWKLVGGWAKVYRRDRERPFFDALNLSVFSTGKSRWGKDPAGMIVKTAEASALRKAFPNACGGLYLSDEMESVAMQAAASAAQKAIAHQESSDDLVSEIKDGGSRRPVREKVPVSIDDDPELETVAEEPELETVDDPSAEVPKYFDYLIGGNETMGAWKERLKVAVSKGDDDFVIEAMDVMYQQQALNDKSYNELIDELGLST